ncbi:MAG: hypothetical protein IR159_01090 [Brevundimonas sp.]|nr:hypothetical protein [Brevundimonas sp.]
MRLTPEELAARNRRNVAIAAGLVVFIILVFGVTVLKLANNADDRDAATPVAEAGAGEAVQ